jgi:hypothetical protein
MCCDEDSSPTLTNCTITGNSLNHDEPGFGTGIYCVIGSPTLTNCIVWDNVGGAVESLSISYSCIEGTDIWPGEGNINEDPAFKEPDYYLQSGSPCIDAGTSEGAPTNDIEGNGRPCGAAVDIGAYEYGDCPSPEVLFRRGDSNADGATDISDGIAILGYLFLGERKVPCEQAGDANDDGALDISDAVYVLSFLFLGGKPIAPPVGTCGVDPTGHGLPCASFPECQ